MKNIILLAVLIVVSNFSNAQDHNLYHVGHSLVSPYMPAMLNTLADSTPGINHDYNFSIINGSPLFYNWNNSDMAQGYQAGYADAKVDLATGDFDVLILTEGVPWDPILSDFYQYADSFHTLAVTHNSSIQTYLYETYNCINTGLPTGCMYDDGDTILWVPRILGDYSTWTSVADTLTARHPANPEVLIIPVGQAFVQLKDSVDAGNVPGINNFFNDFFSDDIHPNDTGFYFTACVHYATVYKRSPVGLPAQTYGEWGGAFQAPSNSQALKLQQIAWDAVCRNPRTGVNCNLSSTNILADEMEINIYPDPVGSMLHIDGDFNQVNIVVLNSSGMVVDNYNNVSAPLTIDTNALLPGMHFIRISSESHQDLWVEKIIKQ